MNLFTTDKSPAILALFATVIGFYISTVAEQLRAQATVTYELRHLSDGRTRLRLENVSREKVVNNAAFEISCWPVTSDCFATLSTREGKKRRHLLERSSPVSPSAIEVTALPVTTQITATLVPGARITITVKGSKAVVRRGHRLEFHYTPDRGAPEPVLLLARNSLTALFVAYYLHIMIVAFFSAAAGLAIIVLWPMIHRLIDLPAYRKREKEPDE